MTRCVTKTTLCSALAIATAMVMMPQRASAQFAGTITSSSGIDTATSTTSNIQITSPQAIVTWTATGAPNPGLGGLVPFLDANSSVTFQSSSDFAVLNRVNAGSSGIFINGTIQSLISQNVGGTVFFSSPNGIVIGGNSVINVGSLGLTTSPIADNNGTWMSGFGTNASQVVFGASDPSGLVRIDTGAIVKSNTPLVGNLQGNYVALVSPTVTNNGTIKTDGTAALIGAEAATVTFNDNGLWDIVVSAGSQGSGVSDGVGGGGTITRNSANIGTNHQAYLVSIAKNSALTLTIGAFAGLGFDIAGSAGYENNVVVLSAGQNITSGVASDVANPGVDNSIFMAGGAISSNLIGDAITKINLTSNQGAATFTGNVKLTAGNEIDIAATSNDFTIAGNLTASVDKFGANGADAQAGTVNLRGVGHALTVSGSSNLTANATGGSANSDFPNPGNGTGGSINVQSLGGGSIVLSGPLTAIANGTGGTGQTGAGGAGFGGNISLGASSGTSVMVGSIASLQATGSGGAAVGSVGDGGGGQGGNIQAYADGGTLGITGNLFESVDGYGGSSAQGTGGAGTGGLGQAFALNGGAVSVGGYASISSYGQGGDGLSGGIGTGGRAYFSSNSGGNLAITGFAELAANGRGGRGSTGNGGLGHGGHAEAYATNALLNFNALYLLANGDGGGASTATMRSGNGVGGDIFLQAISGGTVTIANALAANATGRGGNIEAIGVGGGDGTGGTVTLYSRDGNAALNVSGAADLTAIGEAGSSGECFQCNGVGGVGQGGTVIVSVLPATVGSGNSIDFGNQLTMAANGYGGTSTAVAGGNGGGAFGGRAEIFASAGSAHVVGDASLSANAFGGGSTNGDGGVATGGTARVNSQGGALTFDAALSTHANATGGFGVNGGDAMSLNTESVYISGLIARNGGSINVLGATTLTSTTVGGDAHSSGRGGNAIGTFQLYDSNNVLLLDGAKTGILVRGSATAASSVTLAGLTVDTSAIGGAGANGAIGLSGGNGGSATAGGIDIETRNSDSGTNLISFADATLHANATGGTGGLAGDDSLGGGNGGNATAGFVAVLGSAGNGRVQGGAITIAAAAVGGNGGYGGTNSFGFGPTGNGGNGGKATAGGVAIGVVSRLGSLTSYGSASFGAITADTSAHGGNGGGAGNGSPTLGAGGNGGAALGAFDILYARGATVDTASAAFDARAFGGNGGASNNGSIGGNALAGSILALATTRYLYPAQGATLTVAGSFTGNASAYGGTGLTNGTAMLDGGDLKPNHSAIGIVVSGGSSAHLGSVDLVQTAANGPTATSEPGVLTVVNGTLDVTGNLSIVTDGVLDVLVDRGTVTAANLTLHGRDYAHDPLSLDPAVVLGTITANSFNITSVNNIILDANLNSTGIDNSLYLSAPGLIQTGSLSSVSDVGLTAGSYIFTGGINAGGSIFLDAQGSIQTGNLTAGLDINLITSTGAIQFGDAFASNDFNFQGGGTVDGGTVTGGNITAGRQIGGDATGAVSFGNLTAGFANTTVPTDKGFSIGFDSLAGITIGNATGFEAVGFATFGPLTTGNLTAGTDVLAMVSGNMNLGAITAGSSGRIYLADSSMFIAAGGPDDFIPALVFAATPVATGGSITVGGPISGGSLQAAAKTGFSAGAVDVGGDIALRTTSGAIVGSGDWNAGGALSAQAGGAINLSNLTSGGGISLDAGTTLNASAIDAARGLFIIAGGNTNIGAIRSGGFTDIDSGGTLTGTTISAGSEVSLWGQNGVSVGNIDAGIVNPDTSVGATYNVGIGSGPSGSIVAGTLTAADSVGFGAGSNLTVGTILAGGDTLAMIGGDASFGSVTSNGLFGLTGYDMLALGGGKDNFDKTIVFNALFGGTASHSGGSASFSGPVSASDIYIFTGDLFGGAFDASNDLILDATGNLSAASLFALGVLSANAGGSLAVTGSTEAHQVALGAGTTINTGAVTSHGSLGVRAGGAVTTGDLTTTTQSGQLAAAAVSSSTYDISMRSGGTLTTGALVSAGSIFLGADGGIVTNNLSAVGAVLALAAGDISTGAIAAGNDVYIAGIGDEARGGTIGRTFDPNAVLASAPVSGAASVTTGGITTPGALTIKALGNVVLPSATAAGVVAIGSGNLTAGAISAGGTLGVVATGLASVNGTWSGAGVDLRADDLAISADGAIKGGPVAITSLNANGMFLGDGLTGTGFNLSQDEANRISGARIAFTSLGGNSPAITIGNLALSAAQMTGPEALSFDAGGSILVVGDLAVSGLVDPATSVGFTTPLFMLDESTGTLALLNGSQLGGTLNIHAHDVWVADSTILARLLADPNYAGRNGDLALAPIGVSGPVISANVINVSFENRGPREVTPYTLLVQNTGTATTPQGFLATDANAILGQGASGLIDMVINGQGQGPAGLVNGVAVRDALMEGDDPARFTASSTINGCSVSGAPCGIAPPSSVADPGVVLADQIVFFSIGADDKPLFGNENQIAQNYDEILDSGALASADASTGTLIDQLAADEDQKREEEEAADAASSPIEPPNPLFDSRPLNAKDSTDEPISGGGNPALIGSDIDPTIGGQ